MSASDSESSVGSSSQSRDSSRSRSPSPPTILTSSKRAPSSANTSNTSRYIPTPGFSPVSLSGGPTLSSLQEASSSGSGKQLWTIKVPDGVHPSLLEGLVFDVPGGDFPSKKSKKKSTTTKSLGSLKISRRDEQTGEKQSKDVYHLYAHAGVPREDAKNSLPGQSGKKAKKDGEKSQLVNDAQGEEEVGFAAHMSGLRAYVAVEGGRPGQVSIAPMPISQHLEFVLAPPEIPLTAVKSAASDESDKGFTSLFAHPEESQAATTTTTTRRRELKGYFAPAGSLYDEGGESVGTAQSASTDSSTKKRKKDEIVEAGEVSTSPSSKKSKVKEEKRSSKDKKDKKRKSG